MSTVSLLRESINYLLPRMEMRMELKDEADRLYIMNRLSWLVDKYKQELFENASEIKTDAIFNSAFDVVRSKDVEIPRFDELIVNMAVTIVIAIKRLGGTPKVSVNLFASEFLKMMHLSCIMESLCMASHVDHFGFVLGRAGFEVSSIPKIIEKSMEWAETRVTYDGGFDGFLDDCIKRMSLICHEMGKPVSQEKLTPKEC
jgi:hypothetical protein